MLSLVAKGFPSAFEVAADGVGLEEGRRLGEVEEGPEDRGSEGRLRDREHGEVLLEERRGAGVASLVPVSYRYTAGGSRPFSGIPASRRNGLKRYPLRAAARAKDSAHRSVQKDPFPSRP
jgi:hypothetical protein